MTSAIVHTAAALPGAYTANVMNAWARIDDHAGRRFSVHVDAALEAGSPAAVTFDTLKFVEQVKAGGMPEAKAKAIAQAFRDAQREVDLATKKIPISKAYRIVCSRNVAGVGGLGE